MKTTIASQINQIVKSFDVSGYRVARATVRRSGSRGYGYYTEIDVAGEGVRVSFFRNLESARDWADEMARG